MIQIYSPGNRKYERNGDAVLHPSQCDLEMNLKGDWQLTLENPADENMNLITKEAIIKCDTPIGKGQRFRIYEYEKSEGGVSAKARPVFFDAARDVFILDKRPTNKTGAEALVILTEGTRYTAESDISDINTAYYIRKNLIEAINGEDENSFINCWGGEPVYQNEHLIMRRRYGSDKGAKATFGNNLQSISETVNMDEVATRIIPMAYNGHMLDGDKPWVDSPNINKYAIVYTRVIEYSDVKLKEDISGEDEEGFADLAALREELKKRAKQEFEAGIDLPKVTYEVEVADLENAVGYEEIKDLVKIGLGDEVAAENRKLDIVTKNRCVGLTYDCILQKNKSVILGETQTDYFQNMASVANRVESAIRQDGTVIGQQVQGIINGVKAQMKAQSSIAEKSNVRAVLFEDLDAKSPTYGAMCWGTMGFQIASKRTADDRDWDWSTFGTGQGFFADFIVAGTMLADRIKGGTLVLGGKDNGNGVAKVIDASGNEIMRLDRDGVYAKGKYVCDSVKDDGLSVEIYDGRIVLKGADGKEGYIRGQALGGNVDGIIIYHGQESPITNFFSIGSESATLQQERIYLSGRDYVQITCEELTIGDSTRGDTAKTGKAEFSDGTYLEFKHGILIGGNAKEGGF